MGSLQWAHLLIAACPHIKLGERLTVKRAMAMGRVPIKANAAAKGLQERRKALAAELREDAWEAVMW